MSHKLLSRHSQFNSQPSVCRAAPWPETLPKSRVCTTMTPEEPDRVCYDPLALLLCLRR